MTNCSKILAAVTELHLATVQAIADHTGLHVPSLVYAYLPKLVREGALTDVGGGLYTVESHG